MKHTKTRLLEAELSFQAIVESPSEIPILMAILNLSPDSFYDGGQYIEPTKAIAHAKQMVMQGAGIIDIGAESTRPGAVAIDIETEWQRIEAVLQPLSIWLREENQRRIEHGLRKVWLSVDTYKAEIARRSLEIGAHIINDVSGGQYDPAIVKVMADSDDASYILMHNPFCLNGLPPHAHKQSITYEQPLETIATELQQLYHLAQKAGCKNIVLDPGLGFGKDISTNWHILANLKDFIMAFNTDAKPYQKLPFLVGASNKRFIRNSTSNDRQEPISGRQTKQTIEEHNPFLGDNLAVCAAAILAGVRIIRSHEVYQHYSCLCSSWKLLQQRKNTFC